MLNIDQSIFTWIINLPHPLWLNTLFIIISSAGSLGLIWLLIGLIFWSTHFRKKIKEAVMIFASIGLSFLMSELILKPLISRKRPIISSHFVIDSIGYSFPSGHATVAFAAATTLTLINRRYAWWAFPLALLISFSRLFLGVHYPLDIFFGALFGILIGLLSYKIFKNLKLRIKN